MKKQSNPGPPDIERPAPPPAPPAVDEVTFGEVNDFVHDPDVGFEDLQGKCLELAAGFAALRAAYEQQKQNILGLGVRTGKIMINADALRQVLEALNGPGHLIRELQYTRNMPIGKPNPIDVLIGDYNQCAEAYNKQVGE